MAARDELMSRWRRLTMKVVATMAAKDAPADNMDTAMNWELPANTNMDIRATWKGDRPAFWASTPNASPMGRYPRQMGQAAAAPWVNLCLIFIFFNFSLAHFVRVRSVHRGFI